MWSGLRERAAAFAFMAVDLTVANLLSSLHQPASSAALKERKGFDLIQILPIHLGCRRRYRALRRLPVSKSAGESTFKFHDES